MCPPGVQLVSLMILTNDITLVLFNVFTNELDSETKHTLSTFAGTKLSAIQRDGKRTSLSRWLT